ncbi:MAG TPA: hypothetical protein VI432_00935 [Candidatus Paceibacterota bacterium]
MLSKEAIDEFKKLYKEQYGEELNDFVASEAANRLVRMMDVVYRPIPKAWEAEYNRIKAEQEAVPEEKKRDYVKHLVEDAKVTEFKEKIGEKNFWNLVVEANKKQTEEKMRGEPSKKQG